MSDKKSNKEDIEFVKKAVEEIGELADKYHRVFYDKYKITIGLHPDTIRKIKFGIELKEKYGLETDNWLADLNYMEIDSCRTIAFYDGEDRKIAERYYKGEQPHDEYLLKIEFPHGAYFFGDDYPLEFFKKVISELKSYNPDYIDDMNNTLYWKLENASTIFNSFDEILKRYRKENETHLKELRLEKLKKEQEELLKDLNHTESCSLEEGKQ